jgi:hypothetical protein
VGLLEEVVVLRESFFSFFLSKHKFADGDPVDY